MQQMNKQIKKYTLAFSLFCSIACAMIFHSQIYSGLALNIPTDEAAGKKMGTQEYMKRYLMYGLVLVVCQLMELPILAVLVGLMCNKGAILLYALKEKEDFHE